MLAERVAALEAEMVVVRQEVAAGRALAAGADRDVAEYRAELRAHTRTLMALRETQLEHYAEYKADFAELRADFTKLTSDVTDLKTDVAELKTGISHVVALLERQTPGA